MGKELVILLVMIKTSVAEAKAKLSEYLERAERGERIVICRHNKPVAELRGVEEARVQPRPVGPLPGRAAFEIATSFFEPLSDDELDEWEGGPAVDVTIMRKAPRVAASKATSPGTARKARKRRRS